MKCDLRLTFFYRRKNLERLRWFLTLKLTLKNFDSYFWPLNKSNLKIIANYSDKRNKDFNLKCFYLISLTWWKTYLCFLLIKVGILYGYCIFSPISSSNDLKVEFWSKSFLICANNSDFKEFLFLKSLLCICRLQCACGQCGVVGRMNQG